MPDRLAPSLESMTTALLSQMLLYVDDEELERRRDRRAVRA